jgi:PST family polysaccharide transporter
VYWLGIYLVVRQVSGFRWSAASRRLGLLFVPLVATVFVGWYFLSRGVEVVFGAAVTLFTGVYSLKTLCTLVSLERLPGPVQKIIMFLRLAPLKTKE